MQKQNLTDAKKLAVNETSLINYLKTTLEDERAAFELKKINLSELEQSQHLLMLAEMENLLSNLETGRIQKLLRKEINDPDVHRQQLKNDNIQDFLAWDKQPAIECLTFLLTEFFANSYPKQEWNDKFIAELVFNHARIINLITALKN